MVFWIAYGGFAMENFDGGFTTDYPSLKTTLLPPAWTPPPGVQCFVILQPLGEGWRVACSTRRPQTDRMPLCATPPPPRVSLSTCP